MERGEGIRTLDILPRTQAFGSSYDESGRLCAEVRAVRTTRTYRRRLRNDVRVLPRVPRFFSRSCCADRPRGQLGLFLHRRRSDHGHTRIQQRFSSDSPRYRPLKALEHIHDHQ